MLFRSAANGSGIRCAGRRRLFPARRVVLGHVGLPRRAPQGPGVQVLADTLSLGGTGGLSLAVVHEAVVDALGAKAARRDRVNPVFAAVIDVGVEVARVGFDPLQLSFHRTPFEKSPSLRW